MDVRGALDSEGHLPDESHSLSRISSWQLFRTEYHSSRLSKDQGWGVSSPTSQGLLYAAKLDLFYQKCGGRVRPKRVNNETEASGKSNGKRPHDTAVRKRTLNDVLKLENLRKAQSVLEGMSAGDDCELPPRYLTTLRNTMDMLHQKLSSSTS